MTFHRVLWIWIRINGIHIQPPFLLRSTRVLTSFFTQAGMKNVVLVQFIVIAVNSGLSRVKNRDIPEFWDNSGLLSPKSGNPGLIYRFWGLVHLWTITAQHANGQIHALRRNSQYYVRKYSVHLCFALLWMRSCCGILHCYSFLSRTRARGKLSAHKSGADRAAPWMKSRRVIAMAAVAAYVNVFHLSHVRVESWSSVLTKVSSPKFRFQVEQKALCLQETHEYAHSRSQLLTSFSSATAPPWTESRRVIAMAAVAVYFIVVDLSHKRSDGWNGVVFIQSGAESVVFAVRVLEGISPKS